MYVVCDLLRCVLSFSRVLKWFPQGACMRAKSLQLCPILCNSMDCHPTGSSVHRILQGDIRDSGSVPGSERSPGGGQGNPLQDSCLENPLDRGAWRATVHRNAQSRTQLKQISLYACIEDVLHFSAKSLPLSLLVYFYLFNKWSYLWASQEVICWWVIWFHVINLFQCSPLCFLSKFYIKRFLVLKPHFL